MAKILLHAFCVQNPDNSWAKRQVFYTTGLYQHGNNPISYENTTTITCAVFTLPQGTALEQYCALDTSGNGILRVIEASGVEFTNYRVVDTQSTACDGTCDLNAPFTQGMPTTTTTSKDGTIRIDVTTSNGPVTAYNATLGFPTSNTLYTAAGVKPATYLITYTNVAPGSYTITLQDNANCRLPTVPVVVASGGASGTGTPGLPSNISWLKYEMNSSTQTSGNTVVTSLSVSGRAWNPTLKRVEEVAPIPVNYDAFNENTARYPAGAIVKYTRQFITYVVTTYHRAKSELIAANFFNNNGKIPLPVGQSFSEQYWENLPVFNKSTLHYKLSQIFTQSIEYDYFYSPPLIQNQNPLYNYCYYEVDVVVRFGWDGFYKSKKQLNSFDFPDGRIPAPTGVTDDNWEKIDWFTDFYYAIPATQVFDRYTIGGSNYSVRYHTFDALDPSYYPTEPQVQVMNQTPGTPAQGFDYLIYDVTIPSIETALGDLKVIDVIKNDIDNHGAENGSVAILATSPSMPISYHLRNGVRTGYVQDNETGIYENLSAGAYVVDITDANNRYTNVEFVIEDNYGLRWNLTFDDQMGVPLELRVFEHGWNGAVTAVCGTGEPVELSWDSGGDANAFLPEASGANLKFDLRTSVVQQFVGTIEKDDRNHRVDYYRNNKLHFRGYIDSTQYRETMLGVGQTVTLLATDGLGQLKDTFFVNHERNRQLGRTSMLSIILKCLSYTDVNLPLICGVNLREQLMTADADPLLEAFVNRNAYIEKDGKVIADEDYPFARDVINAILRLFNAMLFQADGCWKIISLSEVDTDFAKRVWSPAGRLYDAATVQAEAIDTLNTPLRILESSFATGVRELYWINSSQSRDTAAAASVVKAVVKLQLEDNLFRNGDFVEWDSSNVRPLYWAKQGNPTTARVNGEKAKEYALKFSSYTTMLAAANYLLSPDVPHMDGQDEDGYVLKFRALMEHTTTDPAELTATLNFQVVVDGAPFGGLLPVVLSSKDKWKDYSIALPGGMIGSKVRVRVLQPVATDAASVASTIKLNSVAISVQPGLRDWSNQKEDFIDVLNPVSTTGKRLPDIELVHADLPQLPNALGSPQPPNKMDVFAWRHAVSLADFTATGAWKRPGAPTYYTLLETAALDRMAMRQAVSTVVTGELKGPGINYLRVGLMLDMPEDIDGKFMVTGCYINEREATASITLLKIADGNYGDILPDVPNDVRISFKTRKKGYRVSYVNGVKGYRISKL